VRMHSLYEFSGRVYECGEELEGYIRYGDTSRPVKRAPFAHD